MSNGEVLTSHIYILIYQMENSNQVGLGNQINKKRSYQKVSPEVRYKLINLVQEQQKSIKIAATICAIGYSNAKKIITAHRIQTRTSRRRQQPQQIQPALQSFPPIGNERILGTQATQAPYSNAPKNQHFYPFYAFYATQIPVFNIYSPNYSVFYPHLSE